MNTRKGKTMNKTFITTPELNRRYSHVIRIPYCALQKTLKLESPMYYNAGTYGWNYDVYDFDDVAIVTGYRNMPGRDIDSDFLRGTDDWSGVLLKTSIDYETTRAALRIMIDSVIERGR